jgi:hypothetical protein
LAAKRRYAALQYGASAGGARNGWRVLNRVFRLEELLVDGRSPELQRAGDVAPTLGDKGLRSHAKCNTPDLISARLMPRRLGDLDRDHAPALLSGRTLSSSRVSFLGVGIGALG